MNFEKVQKATNDLVDFWNDAMEDLTSDDGEFSEEQKKFVQYGRILERVKLALELMASLEKEEAL